MYFRTSIGSTVVLNAGEFSGVYDQSSITVPISPTIIPGFEPSFVSPLPSQVGNIVRVFSGDWLPSSTTRTITIGYGTTIDNFVGVYTTTGSTVEFTLNSAFNGQNLSARVVATNNNISAPAVFINSGVVISGTNTTWPTNITSNLWEAEEVRDSSPEGRRKITLSSSVTIPSGYELKIYSGLTSGELPTISSASITSGNSYTTIGTVPVGSRVYNSLAWLRTSDNAIQRAHPLSEEKSFIVQGLIVTPPIPGSADESPDFIYNNITSVRSKITEWINDWDGTIPSGKNASSDRYIGINVSTSGTLNLTGLINNQATLNSRRIFIRYVGSYFDYSSSVKHTGTVDLSNSRGIFITRAWIIGNPSVLISNSTLCGVTRCLCDGIDFNTTNPQNNYVPSTITNIQCQFSYQLVIAHNLMRVSYGQGLLFNGVNGGYIIGNMCDYSANDDYVFSGYTLGIIFERNWCGRRKSGRTGDPHEDFLQHQGNTSFAGSSLYGNIMLPGYYEPEAVYGSENIGYTGWWYPPSSPWANQGLFIQAESGTPKTMICTNVKVQQNILFTNNGAIKFTNGQNWEGSVCTDNTCISVGWRNPALIQGGWQTWDRNLVFGTGTVGTNGVLLARTGGITRVSSNPDVFEGRATNASITSSWFRYGVPGQKSDGRLKWPLDMIKSIEPQTGTRSHWGFSGTTVGSVLRSREIFDRTYRNSISSTVGYSVVPGDLGWPLAKTWQDTYNNDDYVTTKFSTFSSYDSNGDIVG